MGKFVRVDTSTAQKKRLDVARIIVQTSVLVAVNSVVKVKGNGTFFTIRIMEEQFVNPYVQMGDQCVTRKRVSFPSGSSSDSGDSSIPSEAFMAKEGDFEFQIFLIEDLDFNDKDMLSLMNLEVDDGGGEIQGVESGQVNGEGSFMWESYINNASLMWAHGGASPHSEESYSNKLEGEALVN